MVSQSISTSSCQLNNTWQLTLPDKRTVQRGLLGLTVITSILSLIPRVRLIGAIATRTVGLLSVSVECSSGYGKKNWQQHALDGSKVAVVALGLFAVAVASPLLIMAGLTADIALGAVETVRAAFNDDQFRAGIHAAVSVISGLSLVAIAIGSWEFMVAAALTSAVVLAIMMSEALSKGHNDNGAAFEGVCLCILANISLAGAFAIGKITHTAKTDSHFTLENKGDQPMNVFDKNGKLLGILAPGESREFCIPYKDTLQKLGYYVIPDGNGNYNYIATRKGSYLQTTFDDGKSSLIGASKINTKEVVLKPPMSPSEFPTVPLAGPVARIDQQLV
jgi:hypothetical protein